MFLFSANYTIIEEKIFLIINYDKDYQTRIYELVSINPEGGDIIVEYLIEVLNPENKFSDDIKTLNELISKFILTNGLKSLLSTKNPIEVDKHISLRLYPINGILRQSINKNQNIQPEKKENNLINNNTYSNIMVPLPQTSGYSPIPNPLPQTNGYNNINNNLAFQTQYKGVNNNNNLMANIYTINPQEQNYYLINTKSWDLLSNYYDQNNNTKYGHTKFFINKIPNSNANNSDSYKIKILQKKFLNIPVVLPVKFQVVNYPNLIKILEILNCNKTNSGLFEEISLIQINEGFIFVPLEKHSKISDNLIYIYSNQINREMKSYEPIAVIVCNDYSDRNNKFNKLVLIPQELNLNDIIRNTEAFSQKIQSPCYLYEDIINSHDAHKTHVASQKITGQQNIILSKQTAVIPAHNSLKVKNNMITLSDRLKVIILLAVSQKYEPEKKIDKAHLINPKWLNEYKFKEINSLIESRFNEIIKIWNYN